MTIYTVELDGKQFDVEGPDNAHPQELEAFVRANHQASPPMSTPAQVGMQAVKSALPGFMTPGDSSFKGNVPGANLATDVTAVPGVDLGMAGHGIASLAYGAGQLAPLVVGQSPHQPVDQVISRMSDMAQPGFEPKNLEESLPHYTGTVFNSALSTALGNEAASIGKQALSSGKEALEAAGPKMAAIRTGLTSRTSTLGKAISKTEQGIGINTENIVDLPASGKGLTKVLQDIKDTGDLVKQGLKQDTPEFAQQLKDDYDKAEMALNRGKSAVGDKNFALAAAAKRSISDALNSMVPGRELAQLASRAAYIRNGLLGAGVVGVGLKKIKNILISNSLGGN